jgi:hypothetical protein
MVVPEPARACFQSTSQTSIVRWLYKICMGSLDVGFRHDMAVAIIGFRKIAYPHCMIAMLKFLEIVLLQQPVALVDVVRPFNHPPPLQHATPSRTQRRAMPVLADFKQILGHKSFGS